MIRKATIREITGTVTATGWTHVTFVESDSKPGVEYEIERRWDGAERCSCEAFRFIKGQLGTPEKQCKHIKARGLALEVALVATELPKVVLPRTKSRKAALQVEVETFTFRRAITFGVLK